MMRATLEAPTRIQGFGPVRQLGHVVDDIDQWIAAISQEQNLGHWMVMRNVRLPCHYRGEKSAPVIHVALTYAGDTQIELIQQINQAASPYRESVEAGHYGLHHTAHLCTDIGAAIDTAEIQGYEVICDIRMMGARYAYLESGQAQAHGYVEFLPDNRMMRSMFKQGIQASRRWQQQASGVPSIINIDLKNPLRLIASLPAAAAAWLQHRRTG